MGVSDEREINVTLTGDTSLGVEFGYVVSAHFNQIAGSEVQPTICSGRVLGRGFRGVRVACGRVLIRRRILRRQGDPLKRKQNGAGEQGNAQPERLGLWRLHYRALRI